MPSQYLDEYLVKLGAAVDPQSWGKFDLQLKKAEMSVLGFTGKAALNLLKLDVAFVGVLNSIGLGIIGLADKTAMADQQYRLFGMRMLMTKESARAMQIATDELGASLDQIAYDPELNRRFQYLYDQNIKMGKAMGSEFNQNMVAIRDMRMMYKQFGADLEFLIGGTISKLFDKLGFGSGDILNTMVKLQNWFVDNLPRLSDQISDEVIPIWNDWVTIAKDLGGVIKSAAGDFSFFTGVLLGDHSIQDTEFSFENLKKAAKDWGVELSDSVLYADLEMKTLGHTVNSVAASYGYLKAMISGDSQMKKIYGDLADKESNKATADIYDLLGIPYPDDIPKGYKNPDSAAYFKHLHDETFDGTNYTQGNRQYSIARHGSSGSGSMAGMIKAAGLQYGIDPNFLSAIISQESGYNSGVTSPKGAQGLMQLMPGTAKQYGVDNPYDASQNIQGGTHYLSDLIKQYHGDTNSVLRAYGGLSPDNTKDDYVQSVMRRYNRISKASHDSGGEVYIENLNIQVPHNLPEESWSRFVKESMRDLNTKNARNVTAQTAAGAFH